jgi:alpha-glucosidase (family GH31 glycosyl hydrolase)
MDRTPWNIQLRTGDDRILPTFRFFHRVRRNLMPYIWQEAQYSARTGEPMMRALQVSDASASDFQYYLGRDLLVCPVVEPDVSQMRVYLPPGEWADLWSRETIAGGPIVTLDAPLDRIPVFVRAGTTLPVCLQPGGALGDAVVFSTEANAKVAF